MTEKDKTATSPPPPERPKPDKLQTVDKSKDPPGEKRG
jgi:hypothetical protein